MVADCPAQTVGRVSGCLLHGWCKTPCSSHTQRNCLSAPCHSPGIEHNSVDFVIFVCLLVLFCFFFCFFLGGGLSMAMTTKTITTRTTTAGWQQTPHILAGVLSSLQFGSFHSQPWHWKRTFRTTSKCPEHVRVTNYDKDDQMDDLLTVVMK